MCGISGFALTKKSHGKFPVSEFAKHLLLGNMTRGKDATGYVGIVPGQKKPRVAYHKMPVDASEFVKLHTLDRRTQIALLHTRAKTKGPASDNANNHPVQWNTCFAIHNGSITNDDDVMVEAGLTKEQRVGEVDSFAVPVALEYHGWGDEEDIKSSLHMLKGGFAIAAIDPIEKPGRVLLAKGENSPLHVLTTPQGIFWSSERKALEDAWGAVLGTPPKHSTNSPGEFGWYWFSEGEYWVVDVSSGLLAIRNGRFQVNKSYNYGQYTHGHSWRPYTSHDHEWTCWPNEKNCVFGKDCGSCHTDDCECWSGNPNHPALNEDLKFDELTSKWGTFKSHAEKHKIRKEMVERPTVGVQVIKPASQTTESSTSSTADNGGQSRTTSHLSLVPARNTPDSVDCFFCERPFKRSDSVQLATVIEGIEALHSCKPCYDATKSLAQPIGYDEKFRPQIKRLMDEAKIGDDIVEQAIQETSWEFKMPASLIRHVCTINPKRYTGHDDPDFSALMTKVRRAFLGNVKIVTELRELDRTHD